MRESRVEGVGESGREWESVGKRVCEYRVEGGDYKGRGPESDGSWPQQSRVAGEH